MLGRPPIDELGLAMERDCRRLSVGQMEWMLDSFAEQIEQIIRSRRFAIGRLLPWQSKPEYRVLALASLRHVIADALAAW